MIIIVEWHNGRRVYRKSDLPNEKAGRQKNTFWDGNMRLGEGISKEVSLHQERRQWYVHQVKNCSFLTNHLALDMEVSSKKSTVFTTRVMA